MPQKLQIQEFFCHLSISKRLPKMMERYGGPCISYVILDFWQVATLEMGGRRKVRISNILTLSIHALSENYYKFRRISKKIPYIL